MFQPEFSFSNTVAACPGTLCRVLTINMPGQSLTYGDSVLEIDDSVGWAYAPVERIELTSLELMQVDASLVAIAHDLLFKKAAEVAVILMGLGLRAH